MLWLPIVVGLKLQLLSLVYHLVPLPSGECTFFLFGLLFELHSIIQLDEQKGFELGLVGIDTLQLSDL